MRAYKVLVVEDEALLGLEIVSTLFKAGIHAQGPFSTVAGALGAIETRTFDAVLLDINLNGVPSFDVAATLKRKAIPYAFVTAYDHIPLPKELRNAPLLGKPYQERQLISLTRTLLGMPQEI